MMDLADAQNGLLSKKVFVILAEVEPTSLLPISCSGRLLYRQYYRTAK